MSKLKEYRLFYFKVLEFLIQDSDRFHDVYSEIASHFSPKMYDQYIKAMNKAALIEFSKKEYSPGTHFLKVRITKQGIEEFAHLNVEDIEELVEHHESEKSCEDTEKTFKRINFVLKFIPSFLQNTKAAVVAIITFVVTMGSMMTPAEYSADLMKKFEKIMQLEQRIEELETSEKENPHSSAQEEIKNKEVLPQKENQIPQKLKLPQEKKDRKKEVLPEKIQLPDLKLARAEVLSDIKDLDVELSLDKKIVNLEQKNGILRAELEYFASVKPEKKFRVFCGTGETNSQERGVCSYHKEGVYIVSLRVYNNRGESQIVKEIKVGVKK